MLRADKEHLERDLKRSLLLLAEKELNFFEQCLNSVGTQAALIAGFASAIIVETASDLLLEASLGIQVAWIFATVLGMVLQVCAASHTPCSWCCLAHGNVVRILDDAWRRRSSAS
uniref:Uncharacterized protein n=1 Tax=Calcidiscus leptoporus TaxID=127549 RepID=A0A7S0IZD2_9EUKA|mmetsp:Transcript_31291/g.72808  ORF Transcript_31291/g.72808 Transcript_31291/m.72808 type:complete len:115 (+) Transcript_31291:49-393(+)